MGMPEADQNPAIGALTNLLLCREGHWGETTSKDSSWLLVALKIKGRAVSTNGMEAESRKGPNAEGYSHSSIPLKSMEVQKPKSSREIS